MLRALRETVESEGEDFFLPHPDPERIVAEALGDHRAPEEETVRRHLALCPTCTAEVRLVRWEETGHAGATLPEAPRRRIGRRRTLRWLVAAAALLALAVPIWWRGRPLPSRTDIIPTYYVEATQRATTLQVLRVPSAVATFQIVLPVDLPEDSYPLAVEIRDLGGRLILARSDVRSIYRNSFLLIVCDRRDFPAGDYAVRVAPARRAGETSHATLEFRFRLASP